MRMPECSPDPDRFISEQNGQNTSFCIPGVRSAQNTGFPLRTSSDTDLTTDCNQLQCKFKSSVLAPKVRPFR